MATHHLLIGPKELYPGGLSGAIFGRCCASSVSCTLVPFGFLVKS